MLAAKRTTLRLAGCWYHVRRKFVEVTRIMQNREGIAASVIKRIADLSVIEEKIKTLSSAEKYKIRQSEANVIIDDLHHYLIDNQPKIPPKSLLGQAVSYTLNQWPKLLTYLDDGRLDISNNLSERGIKPFVIGRKGWLFANSVAGAHAAAAIFSIIETCKYHQIESYYYLRFILEVLPQCKTIEDYEKLLPYNIDRNLLGSQLR